jgi:hypothetical protein
VKNIIEAMKARNEEENQKKRKCGSMKMKRRS